MTQDSLLLVHASDLHLERPLSGLLEMPDHVRDALIDAPFRAAEQVFDTVLTENANALLLAGDVLEVNRAGPHGLVFLLEQFARLTDRKIPIYWAGGSVDPPEAWPRSVPLPEGVHIFPAGRVADLPLVLGGEKVACIQGTSCDKDGKVEYQGFHCDVHGLPTVGVGHGTEDSPGHEGDRVHYMALGGRHAAATVDQEPGIAHYCGTPQGRCASEPGPQGCTVVELDEDGQATLRSVATDAVRWIHQTIEISGTTPQEELYDRLLDRGKRLAAQHSGVDLLILWKVRGAGELANRLRTGGLADDILAQLRRQLGRGSPFAWSVSLDCDSPLSVPAEWYDQETARGDLLRQFRAFRDDGKLALDLEMFLPKSLGSDPLREIARVGDARERAELIERAAKLGFELLTSPTYQRAHASSHA